ncbi:MAG: DnaJ domain-containing protein [Ardenticatenales bacterium]|nr:DnaJ domain-containing protein [Ardenticatenales bacterium]
MIDYYEVLELLPSATAEEVRRAYRELVEIHHPDRMRGLRDEVQRRAEARLRLINEAYTILRDPVQRAHYDTAFQQQSHESPTAPAATPYKPGLSRAKVLQRVTTLEQQLAEGREHLATLRPRLTAQEPLDEQWERYLFVALGLLLPYAFLGIWAAILLHAEEPRPLLARAAQLALLALGYLAQFLGMALGRIGPRVAGWPSTILGMPLAVIVFLGAVYLPLPRSMQLVVLAGGYALVLWRSVGQPLSETRNQVYITARKIQRLEEELAEAQREKAMLEAELARQTQ